MRVAGLEPGGPAVRAGLEVGDILVAIDGKPVGGVDDLVRMLTEDQVGRPTELAFLRRTELKRLSVVPMERPPARLTPISRARRRAAPRHSGSRRRPGRGRARWHCERRASARDGRGRRSCRAARRPPAARSRPPGRRRPAARARRGCSSPGADIPRAAAARSGAGRPAPGSPRPRPSARRSPAGPSPRPAHPAQQEGRIAAGDHDEDGGMVEAAQRFLARRGRRQIVERRAGEHRDQPHGIDGDGEDSGGIAASAARPISTSAAPIPRPAEEMDAAVGDLLLRAIAGIGLLPRRSFSSRPAQCFSCSKAARAALSLRRSAGLGCGYCELERFQLAGSGPRPRRGG